MKSSKEIHFYFENQNYFCDESKTNNDIIIEFNNFVDDNKTQLHLIINLAKLDSTDVRVKIMEHLTKLNNQGRKIYFSVLKGTKYAKLQLESLTKFENSYTIFGIVLDEHIENFNQIMKGNYEKN